MELELTESIIFDGSGIEYVRNMIKQMHKTGFACSLDDFGFGYSSLGLLSKLEVDTIKLDKIFFTGDAALGSCGGIDGGLVPEAEDRNGSGRH